MIFKDSKNNMHLNKVKKVKLTNYPYILLLDVETVNDDKIIIDFSGVIIKTETGSIVHEFTWIIQETWETKSMRYGKYLTPDKRKEYSKMIKENPSCYISKQHFYFKLNQLIRDYHLKNGLALAYNGIFDIEAIYNTFDYKNKKMKLWKNKCWRRLMHRPLFLTWDLGDLWTYASIIYYDPKFKKWSDKTRQMRTSSGNRKTDVQTIVRYIRECIGFIETHIAKDDLQAEYNIFMACVWKRGNKLIVVNYLGLWGCWRLAQDKPNKNSKTYKLAIAQKIIDKN